MIRRLSVAGAAASITTAVAALTLAGALTTPPQLTPTASGVRRGATPAATAGAGPFSAPAVARQTTVGPVSVAVAGPTVSGPLDPTPVDDLHWDPADPYIDRLLDEYLPLPQHPGRP